MTDTSRPPLVGTQEGPVAPGRGDTALYALAAMALALIAAQFALAGFGAFAMDKTPADKVYSPHAVVGLLIAAVTVLILAAVLASRPARAHRRTLWLAVALAVLAVAVQPALGDGGTKAPVLGALHALNGLVIFGLTGWLAWETARRRRAGTADGAGMPRDAGASR